MLNYEFPPIGGGAAMAHLALLREYAQNPDLKVDVLTSGTDPGLQTELLAENVTIHRVGINKPHLHHWRKSEVIQFLIRAKPHYRRLLAQNDYQLVHAFFGFPTGWLCWRTKNKIPYIISLRGSDVPGQHARFQLEYKILAPLFKAIWKNAAAVIACSQGLKDRANTFYPAAPIEVIPNGVDLTRFHKNGWQPLPKAGDGSPTPLRLLTVGRLSVTKRVELLIETVEILQKNNTPVTLKVVGGGALESDLKNLIAEKNLTEVVELTGRLEAEQLPEIYRSADIFVSASMQEGMSNAMLEAIASALPIITTRCEGVEELIADNGRILDAEDPATFAATISELAADHDSIAGMSAAAEKLAPKFSWSQTAAQYIDIYEKLIT